MRAFPKLKAIRYLKNAGVQDTASPIWIVGLDLFEMEK